MAAKKPVETEEEKKAREFVEATAQAIIDLSKGVAKLLNGKLKREAVVILIQDSMGGNRNISKEMIERILTAITNLEKKYTNK